MDPLKSSFSTPCGESITPLRILHVSQRQSAGASSQYPTTQYLKGREKQKKKNVEQEDDYNAQKMHTIFKRIKCHNMLMKQYYMLIFALELVLLVCLVEGTESLLIDAITNQIAIRNLQPKTT